VLHYPGKSLIYPQEEEFIRFLKIHGLTEREIEKARAAENLAADSVIAPHRVIETIRAHYGLQTEQKAITRRALAATAPLPGPRETLMALVSVNQRHAALHDHKTSSRDLARSAALRKDNKKHDG